MQVLEDFKCDACLESREVKPTQPPVTLEGIPAKWKHLQADQFEWQNPSTGTRYKCSMIIDENTKLRVAGLLFEMTGVSRHRNPSWGELKSFYLTR